MLEKNRVLKTCLNCFLLTYSTTKNYYNFLLTSLPFVAINKTFENRIKILFFRVPVIFFENKKVRRARFKIRQFFIYKIYLIGSNVSNFENRPKGTKSLHPTVYSVHPTTSLLSLGWSTCCL